MPLNYSIAMLSNPRDPARPKKAYARAQIGNKLTLRGFSKRIASQTTVSRADVSAVLISMLENLINALREGNQVNFGEIGKFRLQISSKGADKAELFTPHNITGVSIQFVPGSELKNLFNGLTFTPVPSRAAIRAVLKAERTGQTSVDLAKGKEGEKV